MKSNVVSVLSVLILIFGVFKKNNVSAYPADDKLYGNGMYYIFFCFCF